MLSRWHSKRPQLRHVLEFRTSVRMLFLGTPRVYWRKMKRQTTRDGHFVKYLTSFAKGSPPAHNHNNNGPSC